MIINRNYEVLVDLTDAASSLDHEFAGGLARLLIRSDWLGTDFPAGFCISDDEDICNAQPRQPVVLLPDDQDPVEDTLVRRFEFRFDPTPELVLKRDLLIAAFAKQDESTDPLLFVTEPVTITDPYTKAFIELSLIVSVSWRDPEAAV